MSAEPISLKTEAEQGFSATFKASRATLPGTNAVAEKRAAAMARFERRGLPHRRVEAWKYTDLRALMKKAAPLAPAPAIDEVRAALAAHRTFPELDRHRLVIADGYFVEDLSDRTAMLSDGIEVATLAEFLGFDGDGVADILNPPPGADDDALVAINVALATDGVVVLVAADTKPQKPIEIVHVTTRGAAASSASSVGLSSVDVGKNAKVKVLASHIGPDGAPYRAIDSVGFRVQEAADVTVVDLQNEGDAAQHVATFGATLAAGSMLRHVAVRAGGAIARLQGFVRIDGEDASFTAAGANMLAGTEHGDVSWRIDHATPGATSRVLYKNASADDAFGAFQGLILVRPEAQKTDGKMMTRTILLSDEAQFAAKPELEIYADDVQCGHGATIGQIDEASLFYLRARGIPKKEAEALLIKAFLAEALDAIDDDAIAGALDPLVSSWLEQRK